MFSKILVLSFMVFISAFFLFGCQTTDDSLPSATKAETTMTEPAPKTSVSDGMVHVEYAFPTGQKNSSVILLEKSAPAQVQVGQAFDYEIKVTNLTDCALEAVVVTDALRKSYNFKSAVPKPDKLTNQEIRWDLGGLDPEKSKTIRVNGVPTGQGAMTQCAKVAYRTPLCLTVVAIDPKLALTKTGLAEAMTCDTIPYRYVVTNTGTGTAKGVMIKDIFADGLTDVDGNKSVMFNAGDLMSGESREFSILTKASKVGTYKSTAIASGQGGLEGEAEASTLVRDPMLVISAKGPNKRFIGLQSEYEITVTNKGPVPARETVLQNTVHSFTQFVSASHDGQYSEDGIVSWNLGNLEPNASKTVSLTVKGVKGGSSRKTATAQAICADPVSTSFETRIEGIPAVLLEVVDLEDPIEVGNNETYVIMATNQGSADGTNISIVCELEENAGFVSATGATTGMLKGRTIEFKPLTSLAPKSKATWRVVVKADKGGDVRFRVKMTSDQSKRPVEESESTYFYE